MLKTRFPFFIKQESALIQKHYQSPRIVILKAACRFFVLLLSTFRGFFHFCRGFCLRLWQLCSLLCSLPQRSTERSKKKKRCLKSGAITYVLVVGSCCNALLFPGNLDPSSLTPGGPVVSLVWGEIICWLGASRLRTFMS